MPQSRSLPSPPEITDAEYNADCLKSHKNNNVNQREQFNNSSKNKNSDDTNTRPFKSAATPPPTTIAMPSTTSISTQQPSKPASNSALVPTTNTILKAPSKRSFPDAAAVWKLDSVDIIHDPNYCMFKIQLDAKGNTAALCYLPTRYKNIIEFYHIEIPTAYRNKGLGDLLLYKAFEWVQKANMMVIPTCPFVLRFLETRFPDQKSGNWSCIILNEKERASSS